MFTAESHCLTVKAQERAGTPPLGVSPCPALPHPSSVLSHPFPALPSLPFPSLIPPLLCPSLPLPCPLPPIPTPALLHPSSPLPCFLLPCPLPPFPYPLPSPGLSYLSPPLLCHLLPVPPLLIPSLGWAAGGPEFTDFTGGFCSTPSSVFRAPGQPPRSPESRVCSFTFGDLPCTVPNCRSNIV